MLHCKRQSVFNRKCSVPCVQGSLEVGGARTIAKVIEVFEQGSATATDGWNQMALHLRRIAGVVRQHPVGEQNCILDDQISTKSSDD